jgi:hypothetical protein
VIADEVDKLRDGPMKVHLLQQLKRIKETDQRDLYF